MYSCSVMSLVLRLVLYAVLVGLLAKVSAQGIKPCNQTTAVQPFKYNISNLAASICPDPPVSGSQDALLCIPGPVSATIESFSLTSRNDVAHPIVCIMRNTTLCGDIGEGEFDGIVIKLSTFPLSGNLEISGLLGVYYGNGSRPLEIVSGKTLSIPGSLAIVERIFNGLGLTSVCEILDNGTYIASEFSTTLGTSDCLKAAGEQFIDSSVAGSLTLSSHGQVLSEQRTATLVLIPNTASCSPTAERVSNIFTVNIEVNQTTTPEPTTTDPPISPPPPSLDPGTIAGIVVGCLFLVLLISVVPVVAVCWCRNRNALNADVVGGSDHETFEFSESSKGSGKPDEADSGVGWSSPPPSTPVKCIVIVVWKLAGPWYRELKSGLGTAFDSALTELVLADDSNQFVSDAHYKLELPHVKHLLLIQNTDESAHPSSFQEVVKYFESRPCDVFSKVWDIRLGAQEEGVTHNHLHRLRITQSNASSTGEECAKEIYRRISYYDLQHPSVEEVLTTNSLDPHQWSAIENKNTASLPTHRKGFETQLIRGIQEIQLTMKGMSQKTGDLAEKTGKLVETTGKIAETTDTIAEITKRTNNMMEVSVTQQEEDSIVGLDNQEETNEPTES